MLQEGKDVGSLVAVSLLKSEYVGRAEIEVEVSEGIITLNGVVASQDGKDNIETLARHQEGVEQVINNLVISDFLDEDY